MRVTKKVLFPLLAIIVLGIAIPSLWPTFTGTATGIAALNGTDAGTTFVKLGWPIVLVIIGIAIMATVIVFAVRRFRGLGR